MNSCILAFKTGNTAVIIGNSKTLYSIYNIDVVNDRAKRGVKLIQEYIGSAHCESDLQEILLAVDNQKSILPNFNKVLLHTFLRSHIV